MKILLKNLDSEFKKANKALQVEVKGNLEKVSKTFLEDVRAATPIDTGKARASWNLSETKDGFSVENTVDYIDRLNAGSSKQAPAHFIEATALKYGTPQGAIVEPK